MLLKRTGWAGVIPNSNLNINNTKYCLLAQAVIWLGDKEPLLPFDVFASVPCDEAQISRYINEQKQLFIALSTGQLKSFGVFLGTLAPWDAGHSFHGFPPRKIGDLTKPPINIPTESWNWDWVQWSNSRLVAPSGVHSPLNVLLNELNNNNMDLGSVVSVLIKNEDLFAMVGEGKKKTRRKSNNYEKAIKKVENLQKNGVDIKGMSTRALADRVITMMEHDSEIPDKEIPKDKAMRNYLGEWRAGRF